MPGFPAHVRKSLGPERGLAVQDCHAHGNWPEICRRHYAMLIPEEMRDVVEFDVEDKHASGDDETKKMLQEILAELKGNRQLGLVLRKLKLVRVNEPA